MPKMRTRLALLGAVAWIGIARAPIPVGASNVGITCIEVRRTAADLVVAPVQIEAEGAPPRSYSFLLDTGSSSTLLDAALADTLHLAATSRTTIVTPTGPIEAITSRASLTFGSVRAGDVEIVRDSLTALRAIEPEIHGVLGQDVLRRSNWQLDYRLGVVIQDRDGALGEHLRGDRLPVHWNSDQPTVDASFGHATPVRLVLDSGATSLVLFKLPIGTPTGAYAQMKTLGIEKAAPILTADALRIGSLALPRPMAAILTRTRDADETGGADGVLPTSLFDSLYFNQNDRTVTVTPASGSRVNPGGCGR
jgi:predicted aspartyl protease